MPQYSYECPACNGKCENRTVPMNERDRQDCATCGAPLVRLFGDDVRTAAIHTPFGYLPTKHRDDPDAESMVPMTDYSVKQMRERVKYKREQHRKKDLESGRCPDGGKIKSYA